jgi:ribosomal protein L37AE/L43A
MTERTPARVAVLPDGRRILASQDGPLGDWAVAIDDGGDAASGRWLLTVLIELLGLPRGDRPAWLFDAVRDLVGVDTSLGRRYPCPCCDNLTLSEPATGTFWICDVCRWEDDNLQYVHIDDPGGANQISLRQARENYWRHGTCKPHRDLPVRAPLPAELPPGQADGGR